MWTNLGHPNLDYLPYLAVSRNPNGCLEVFGVGAAHGNIWHNWETAPLTNINNGTTWSGWNLLGTSSDYGQNLISAQNADGHLEVFLVGSNSYLYHNWQTVPGSGPWNGWGIMGTSPLVSADPDGLAVAAEADGRLHVFCVGQDGNLYRTFQKPTSQGGGWSPFELLETQKAYRVAACRNADGRLEVFLIKSDNTIWHAWQAQANASDSWSGWEQMAPGQGWLIKVCLNPNNCLEAFLVGMDFNVYHNWQTVASGGPWSGWNELGVLGNHPLLPQALMHLAVGFDTNGRMQLYVLNNDTHVYYTYQASNWGTWQVLSPTDEFQIVQAGVIMVQNEKTPAGKPHGTLSLFMTGSSNWQYDTYVYLGPVEGTEPNP